MSPSNVYARSADFKLEIAGDKFTPATQDLLRRARAPTTYISPQQLSANVAATLIAAPGARNIIVRTPDNSLYSDACGIERRRATDSKLSLRRHHQSEQSSGDIAIVQDKSNKNIMNVHRGDLLSGRFRVTSISDKELVMTDTTLKI